MKTQIISLALLSLTIFSCKKETAVLNGLEGKWNVSELQFSGYTQKDSVVKVTQTSIEFDACNADENNTTTSGCNVYITEAGVRNRFAYQVQVIRGQGNLVNINAIGDAGLINSPAYQKALQKWDKSYQIIELGEKNLVLIRNYGCVQINGVDNCNKMKVIASK
jgi:galactitol-specific phosphotransferase system IIB component